MKEYKKLKKFMLILKSMLEKDSTLFITTDLVRSILESNKIDPTMLGGPGELSKLLKIHPRFKELSL